MKFGVLLTVVLVVAVLFVYVVIEWRINQRACAECRMRVSVDNPDPLCPRCETPFEGE
jgi:hypothetical protein